MSSVWGPLGDQPATEASKGFDRMTMNTAWAISELEAFQAACERNSSTRESGTFTDAISRIPVVEMIADRAWPDWRSHLDVLPRAAAYVPMLHVAAKTLVLLRRKDEIQANLGEVGPSLSASTMHRDVWDASRSLWRNGHFGEAVSSAAKSVNAALQSKVTRRDASDMKLVSECFSLDVPKPGVPRLRLMPNDGSDTYKSMHEGALAFGRGCFMGIRNVLAHEYGQMAEPPEEVALHYLAAFSVLARWIDQAKVERV